MKEKLNVDNCCRVAFVIFAFCLFFVWSLKLPVDAGPDETMKYDIIEYIVKYARIPLGGDQAVRNSNWGFSYAYFPILSYMISSVFVKVAGLFFSSLYKMYVAARFTSVLFGTGTVIMTMLISDKLFLKNRTKWLFVMGVSILPQVVFLNSYINNDSMALFSIALIIYAWLCGMESAWNIKSSIMLAVGAGICALSYYNAYGYLLTSVILYVCYFILHRNKDKKIDWKKFFQRAVLMCVIAFVLAGWWFIRSAIHYHGDFLGMRSMDAAAEKYAIDTLKPSNMKTPQNLGQSIWFMYLDRKWIEITIRSFIAGFGGNNIFMPLKFYCAYFAVIAISVIGLLGRLVSEVRSKHKKMDKNKQLLVIMFGINIVIVIGLSTYYSYYSDFQPQGRYIMPAVIPFIYFFVKGIEWLLETAIHKQWIRRVFYTIAYIAGLLSPVLCLCRVIVFYY